MNRKEQILEKAELLFAEHGFEGTSIRALAKEAEVNIAMVSYYFGSKEKLFQALVEYRAAYLWGKLKALNEQSLNPIQRLEELIKAYVERFLSQTRFHRILYREISLNRRQELHQNIADILMRNVTEFRKILSDGIEQGYFREVDVDLTIVTFIGTITQLITTSPQMHQRMLGQKLEHDFSENELIQVRLIDHLKSLMNNYLIQPKFNS
jgi:AcrR family transcriptional regulator